MEIDEVAVDKVLWAKAKAGDNAATNDLQEALDGLILYFHAFPMSENQVVVALRDLAEAQIINSIKISKKY